MQSIELVLKPLEPCTVQYSCAGATVSSTNGLKLLICGEHLINWHVTALVESVLISDCFLCCCFGFLFSGERDNRKEKIL